MKIQKIPGCYRMKILTVSPDEQQPFSGEQDALEKQLQQELLLGSLSEFWDKTEFNLFLTISKTKDSKNVALFEWHRVPFIV